MSQLVHKSNAVPLKRNNANAPHATQLATDSHPACTRDDMGQQLGAFSFEALPGDVLFIVAGAAWGGTTVYIRKYMTHSAEPLQILFYQLFFSAPFLLVMSIVFERPIITGFSFSCVFVV